MPYRIFLSYGSGDEQYVRALWDSVSVVDGLELYVAEWVQAAGVSLRDKVAYGIDGSRCLIAFYTSAGISSQWMNQEVGYAYAKRVVIIPIKEDYVEIKGFLEGVEYIKFDPYDFNNTIYNVLSRLRSIFPQLILEPRLTNFWITCPTESEKFLAVLPTQEEINAVISKNQYFVFTHQKCGTMIHINPKTLRPL